MASPTGPLEGTSTRSLRHGASNGRDRRASASFSSPLCPSDCTGCDPSTSATDTDLASERPLQGGALVVASIGYFLLPLAAALLGALLAGEGALRQLAGASTGLLAATVTAALVAGILRRRWPEGS